MTNAEKLFETFVKYSSFKDIRNIRTDQDLNQMFDEVNKDAESKNRNKPIPRNSKLRPMIKEIFQALPHYRQVRHPKKQYTEWVEVQTTPIEQGKKEIFAIIIKYKTGNRIMYKDSRGRFTKKPTL